MEFITEYYFAQHMNITDKTKLNQMEIIYKR
jgi:hypothetical protein